MIHRISSSLKTFKELTFKSGLNILVAQKEKGSTLKQTRNGAGKSSLIEIVHFLTGAKVEPDSIFRTNELIKHTFTMDLDVGDARFIVERSGETKAKVQIEDHDVGLGWKGMPNTKWRTFLGAKMFGLDDEADDAGPTFRSLFSYFARRQVSEGFTSPEKHSVMQQTGDYQVALLFMIGLDWKIAADWQQVRNRERMLTQLRKAAGDGAFGSVIGRAAELRTQLMVADARLADLLAQLRTFRVLPQYREYEIEADNITAEIRKLSDGNTADASLIRDLNIALEGEKPPSVDDLQRLYSEAGVALPGLAIRRYSEVAQFHESVVNNRRDYLSSELVQAQQRVSSREAERRALDERRAIVMELLRSHGALDQFGRLQSEANRLEADAERLRQRFAAAEQLEGTKNQLEVERKQLSLRLRRDFAEQKARLAQAILTFEATSSKLYESAGSMTVDDSDNGPVFSFHMQGARSKGIQNMQIFCFDMMLMQLCASRGIGPRFLMHDSHLFDGVDGRQVVSALKVGAEIAKKNGFQYVVTMNEDDVFKERINGFDVREYVLNVRITDATESGGLFGIRFA